MGLDESNDFILEANDSIFDENNGFNLKANDSYINESNGLSLKAIKSNIDESNRFSLEANESNINKNNGFNLKSKDSYINNNNGLSLKAKDFNCRSTIVDSIKLIKPGRIFRLFSRIYSDRKYILFSSSYLIITLIIWSTYLLLEFLLLVKF